MQNPRSFKGRTWASVGHRADFFFDFGGVHHDDGVPRAAIQEAAVRPLAEALFAADTENRINLDAPERRIVLIRDPEHAVFHRAIFHAGGAPPATRADTGDASKALGVFLCRR